MISYLQVENLTKSYGELTLFENISFGVGQGQKIALIAKNGTGKTTLLNIISGLDSQDSGDISFRSDLKIAYLEQNPDLNNSNTILNEVFNSTDPVLSVIRDYERIINENDQEAMSDIIEKMDQFKAWDYENKVKQILSKLKITNFDQIIGELSGGQKKRVGLAKVLITDTDFLILDEPTNHLDLEMIEWLEEYLNKSKGTLLMVTHDRYFLDRVCNEIIEIESNTIFTYKGNYSYYLEKRAERIENLNAEVGKAQKLMKTEQEWIRRMPQARGTKAKYRVDAFEDIKKKASSGFKETKMDLDIKSARLGNKILELDRLYKSYGDLKILEDFSYKFQRGEKIGIVGKNGTGKSTFLNMITRNIEADSGSIEIGETVVYGYYKQDGITINENERIIDVIKEIAESIDLGNGKMMSASQFLEYFLFPTKTQYNQVAKLSGGEKRRLYLMTVLMKNPNFLILDEPTNDLDIMTLNVLEDYLLSFSGCLIIVSHDRYFMDKVVDQLFVFEGNGIIRNFPGNYTIYRDSLDQQEKEIKKTEKLSTPKKEKPKSEPTKKLSFNEKREFEQLEIDIETLTSEKEEIEIAMSSGNLSNDELMEKASRIEKVIELIDEKEFRWLELSERA
ncbi:ATP-binding cassette domain-containing protein [Labilibaculum sp. A4]|uniref:ABC-F family ATP-binding cassette domain-containing protein n=1 Tax=Labilibaculum euxinus TaxID=2686357 RepID=UPI000F626A80|nr:ABC-F family ATP-binding cassette domain-containing protein [Labilibaculum euxinus]MDQ1769452.1 ABC-F family ATP-binding cassette domain-containing protein [Labilibaculum euxinus]MWN74976.1 ATP-binding cassette domain-containing protein [Labilibaculum euxinus]